MKKFRLDYDPPKGMDIDNTEHHITEHHTTYRATKTRVTAMERYERNVNMARDYKNGMSMVEIGFKYDMTPNSIGRAIKNNTPDKLDKLKAQAALTEQLIKEYNSGTNTVELAKKYGINKNAIYWKVGLYIRKPKRLKAYTDDVVKDFKAGLNMFDLMEKYGLRQHNIYPMIRPYVQNIREARENNIVSDRDSGMTINKIVIKYKLSNSGIKRILAKKKLEKENE